MANRARRKPTKREIPATLREVMAGVAVPRMRVGATVLLRVASAAAALALPLAAARMVGAILQPTRATSEVAVWVGALIGVLGVYVLLEFIATVVAARARLDVTHGLRLTWFDRLQRAPFEDIDRGRRQNTVALLSQDAPRIASLVVSLPTHVVHSGVVIVGAFVAMSLVSLQLAAAVLLGAPIAFLLVGFVARRLSARSRQYWDAEIDLVAHTDQTFSILAAIKSFAAEDHRLAGYDLLGRRAADLGSSHQRLVALVGPMTQFITFSAVVLVVFAGSVWLDQLAPERLTAFVMYGLLASGTLRSLASAYGSFADGSSAAARFADGAPARPERPGGIRLDEVDGELELDAITFTYGDRTPVFDGDSSLLIRAGDTVVLVGENGAGKSTLVALLLRFRELGSGMIRLDGVSVRDLDIYWYRRQFAVVHQDPVLFDGSLRDNVTLGRPDATNAEVEAACEAALLDDLLATLPDGLDTRVGDAGTQLSGGQRQRVALARAFLVDAPILVLDEATSMFDPASEERFIELNRERFRSKTVIWITHGDAALDIADRVISLRRGDFRAPLRKVEAHG